MEQHSVFSLWSSAITSTKKWPTSYKQQELIFYLPHPLPLEQDCFKQFPNPGLKGLMGLGAWQQVKLNHTLLLAIPTLCALWKFSFINWVDISVHWPQWCLMAWVLSTTTSLIQSNWGFWRGSYSTSFIFEGSLGYLGTKLVGWAIIKMLLPNHDSKGCLS